ncbi:VapE domain-containing protein [Mesorhizobium sp. M0185]|uniref:VapE domain-containing protein n=1 Tax=Mesorhizobium sp. M0185 TaxID=2956907 RepID=UPI00333A58D9
MSKFYGSSNIDDPDREKWTNDTEHLSDHVYRKVDKSYAFTIQRGRNVVKSSDGAIYKTVYRTVRDNMLRHGDRINPEDKVDRFFGIGDEEPILYHLPELIEATKAPGCLVLLCEGEKDVETAMALSFVATANPFGALKWKSSFSQHLKDVDAVILVDNDQRGRQHADQVAVSIGPHASGVRLLELPDLPDKGDISDWVVARRATGQLDDAIKSELLGLIADAPNLEDWRNVHGLLSKDKKGVPLPTQANIRAAIEQMGVLIRQDEFEGRMLVDGLPNFGPLLDDSAMRRLWLEVDTRFRLKVGKDFFWDVVGDLAMRNTFHPVRDYLDSLSWDGVSRIDSWLTTYAGAKSTEYTRAVGCLMLVAAVRRVKKPGCKFDEMPVWESPQGKNKSSALAVLAVKEGWFTDDLPLTSDSKQVIERLSGRWIVEAAELKGMRKGDIEHLKSFLSRQVDRARLAYGRLTSERLRQCIIVGTTNNERYLRDGTGNRRFWPIRVEQFDLDKLKQDRDQLWAEAVAREADGESIRLSSELWEAASEEQSTRAVEDPFVGALAEALGTLEGKLKSEDVWSILNIPIGSRHQEHNARLGEAMQVLGWERKKLRFGGPSTWAYVKGDALIPQQIHVERYWNESSKTSELKVFVGEDTPIGDPPDLPDPPSS